MAGRTLSGTCMLFSVRCDIPVVVFNGFGLLNCGAQSSVGTFTNSQCACVQRGLR